MKKQNFLERVLTAIKGGDEAKIARFSTRFEKYIAKEKAKRTEMIETLEEKASDEQEALKDYIDHLDVSQIKETESTDAYVVNYTEGINKRLTTIEELEDRIDTLKQEIVKFDTILEAVFGKEAE